MKKTNYKIVMIISIIFCAFFINIVGVKADYNSELLSITCGTHNNDCSEFVNDKYELCQSQNKTYNDCKNDFDRLVTNNDYVNSQLGNCESKTGNDLIQCNNEVISNCMNAYSNNDSTAKKIKEATIQMNRNYGIYHDPADAITYVSSEIEIDCDDYKIFNRIWKFIVIGAPFLTIALGIMDLIKIVVASDMKETQKLKKNFITRIIALVLLILTPIIVYVLLTTLGMGKNKYLNTMRCIVAGK